MSLRTEEARSLTHTRFLDDTFPLVVVVTPMRYDERSVEQMAAGYERYFARGDRYAIVNVTPRDADPIGARERKAVTDWASSARVRQKSGELCVGSSTVVKDAIARGALTAMLWLWKPASPHHVTTSVEDAVDWTISKLEQAGVPMPLGPAKTRARALAAARSY